jgi:hypothetical protein
MKKIIFLSIAAALCAAPVRADEAKKAVILVSSPANEQAWLSPLFLQRREEEEQKYYKGLGYETQVVTASVDALLDALAAGATAISYIGPAGADARGSGLTPTLGGMSAQGWKGAVAVYFTPKEGEQKAQLRSRNLGFAVVRNFSCRGGWDHSLAELFVRPGGHYFGAKGDLTHDPRYEKLADFVRGCTKGGDCPCEVIGQYSALDLKDYELPKLAAVTPLPAGAIAGTWYVEPAGTFEVDQRGEDVSWVLSIPERHLRHEGSGSFSRGILNGTYADTENPGGLHAGEYKGWQVTSEGKLCGQVRWWIKEDPAKGAGAGFDCYSRQPLKK